MPTVQTAIVATTVASQVLRGNGIRKKIYIQNYLNVPSSQVAQTVTMYVAFGKVATPGLNGEDEIPPGAGFTWENHPEPVSVVTQSGTAYGAIKEIE